MNKTIVGICTLIELGCIASLAAIGFKRNNDAYKAEIRCIDVESKLFLEQLKGIDKDYEIKKLQKELNELKSQNENEES